MGCAITSLVIGGARSGKSRYAERLADAHAGPRAYIATAQAFDDEMTHRIARHQDQRGPDWHTIEAPFDLCGALTAADQVHDFILVDCITLWLSNMMLAEKAVADEVEQLAQHLAKINTRTILVTNEVGQGIVPENAMARAFRDHAGLANQRLAQACDEVVLVTAGLPLKLKG